MIILFNARRSYDVKCLVTSLVTKRPNYCTTVKKSFKTEEDKIYIEAFGWSPAKVGDFSGAYRSFRGLGCAGGRPDGKATENNERLLLQ